MKLNKLLFLFVLANSLIFSIGCTKKQDTSKRVLNLAISAKVKGFDPIYSNDAYSAGEIARVYEAITVLEL